MKQRISEEQLQELTPEQREKLREWFEECFKMVPAKGNVWLTEQEQRLKESEG